MLTSNIMPTAGPEIPDSEFRIRYAPGPSNLQSASPFSERHSILSFYKTVKAAYTLNNAVRSDRVICEYLFKKNKRSDFSDLFKCRRRPIFPGGCPPSIFGTIELNYRVRDGNGWDLNVIDTDCR